VKIAVGTQCRLDETMSWDDIWIVMGIILLTCSLGIAAFDIIVSFVLFVSGVFSLICWLNYDMNVNWVGLD
jgi:hypothetical protein